MARVLIETAGVLAAVPYATSMDSSKAGWLPIMVVANNADTETLQVLAQAPQPLGTKDTAAKGSKTMRLLLLSKAGQHLLQNRHRYSMLEFRCSSAG